MEDDKKVRGYCRICKYIRQTRECTTYCVKDEKRTLLNYDCKDFELDGIVKNYIDEYNTSQS